MECNPIVQESEMRENHKERKEQFFIILGNQKMPTDNP
jgi:hypothetical protein